jgi:hypothetical protein
METADRTLLIVGACGAIAAAGFGALAAAGLGVTPPLAGTTTDERVVVGTQEVFTEGAPPYPAWAPEPLYPEAERDPMDEFSDAWDGAMAGDRASGPVVFRPPQDLPPPYEVRMPGEAQTQRPPEAGPRVVQVPSDAEGRYAYGNPPQAETDDGKPKD